MRTIACVARKGGVGKSTLARSLAVQAAIDGHRSAIVDGDPQMTLEKWAKRREAKVPAVITTEGSSLAARVSELRRRKSEWTFIDTPPFDQPLINLAAKEADFSIIVTEPAAESLEQIGSVAAILKGLKGRAGIVINKANPKSLAFAAARGALATFGLPVCPQALTALLTHQYSAAEGQTAQEREPGGKAAREIEAIWKWLEETVNG